MLYGLADHVDELPRGYFSRIEVLDLHQAIANEWFKAHPKSGCAPLTC